MPNKKIAPDFPTRFAKFLADAKIEIWQGTRMANW